MKKGVLIFAVIVVLFFTIHTIVLVFHTNKDVPHSYPNSEWMSEDGTVRIKVIEEVIEEMIIPQAYVFLSEGNSEWKASLVYRSYEGGGRIMFVEEVGDGITKTLESWTVKRFSENEFTVKVSHRQYDMHIFEDGSIVTFYRVDNESDRNMSTD